MKYVIQVQFANYGKLYNYMSEKPIKRNTKVKVPVYDGEMVDAVVKNWHPKKDAEHAWTKATKWVS